MAQPISVNPRSTGLPCVLYFLVSQDGRKLRQQVLTPSRQYLLLECRQFRSRSLIKIAFGHQGVSGCLAFDVAADIPPIFAQQGVRVILRMTLEKYQESFLLLDKGVHTGI